ncbi:hypothetical protein PBY51_008579 [Eleginops maclovinus]|uniref:Uncharacterized protein n=1 Tax=Eleginops maclovinus TaxID=56733 RepID=A0AAN8ABI2_ELEMC|nr:hypothetical protein PBY51_008579 [Eleginops maclovinus]
MWTEWHLVGGERLHSLSVCVSARKQAPDRMYHQLRHSGGLRWAEIVRLSADVRALATWTLGVDDHKPEEAASLAKKSP